MCAEMHKETLSIPTSLHSKRIKFLAGYIPAIDWPPRLLPQLVPEDTVIFLFMAILAPIKTRDHSMYLVIGFGGIDSL